MAYNISVFVNDSNTTMQIISNINTESGGFFALGILITLFVMTFIGLKFYETRVAFLAASTTTTFLAIMFWWASWISFTYLFVPITLLFVSLIWNALGE